MCKEIVKYKGGRVKDSFIRLSKKPGAGVEIKEDGMGKYAIPGIPFLSKSIKAKFKSKKYELFSTQH